MEERSTARLSDRASNLYSGAEIIILVCRIYNYSTRVILLWHRRSIAIYDRHVETVSKYS